MIGMLRKPLRRARVGRTVPCPVSTANEDGFGLVEALIAVVILVFGLLAIAGIALSVAQQTNRATIRTDQVFAGQQVLEAAARAGYGNVSTTDTTVTVGDRTYDVSRSVSTVSANVEKVQVVIEGVPGRASPDTLTTFLHN